MNSADADDRHAAVERARQPRDARDGKCVQRRTTESAALVAMRRPFRQRPGDRRIGRNAAIDADIDQHARDRIDLRVREIGRDLRG